MSGRLGCAELCLGGKFEEKLDFLEDLGLWLELANIETRDLLPLDSYDVEVKTVQAYRLHELHWLSKKKEIREAAYAHVLDTVRLAEKVGAQYVLTVPTYGFDLLKNPRGECVENYRRISKGTDLTVLIEALSQRQTSFLPSLPAAAELVEEIARDNVGLAADTWHVEESGDEVAETLRRSRGDIIELHLRDTDSMPPGKGGMDFNKILRTVTPSLLCLEFKTGSPEDVMESCRHLQSLSPDVLRGRS